MASSSSSGTQSLVAIAEYHNDVIDSLTFYMKSLFADGNERFLGISPVEFNRFVRDRIEETELRSSLTILAAVEAAIRVDYQLRSIERHKDALSREFRATYQKKQERARFDEDLLDPWIRHYPAFKGLIAELRAALHLRHWLAHGRYWNRPVHGRFDFQSLYRLAELTLLQLPLNRN